MIRTIKIFILLVIIPVIGLSLPSFFSVSRNKLVNYANAQTGIEPNPNFKVAIIGDTGRGTDSDDFQGVLNLIAREPGVDLVLHQGDNAYGSYDPTTVNIWKNMILDTIPNIPYLGSEGNHEADTPSSSPYWTAPGSYGDFYKDMMSRWGIPGTDPNIDEYWAEYGGLKIVFTGDEKSEATSHLNNHLSGDNHIWKICSWHKNMTNSTPGPKSNGYEWSAFEACRNHGALILNGHSHVYGRSKTVTSMSNSGMDVDPECDSPNHSCVAPGKTVVIDSSRGGKRRSLVCDKLQNNWWASAYGDNGHYGDLNDDGIIETNTCGSGSGTTGALFITFNYNGNPNLAFGEFKTVTNEVIDTFTLTASGTAQPPGPTNTPGPITPTPTNTPPPVATPTADPTKTRYQAEDAALTAAIIETEHAGFDGTGYVNFNADSGAKITFTNIFSDSGGTSPITFRYALGTTQRTVDIRVNGTNYSNETFSSTGTWTTWVDKTINVNLVNGSNIIEAITTGQDGPNIDYLSLESSSPTPTPGDCTPTNGDANGDGQATPNDFSAWAYYFHPFNTHGYGPSRGDFNCDGYTNANDFSLWSFYFVPVGGGNPTPTPTTPEQPTNTPTPPLTGDCSQNNIVCSGESIQTAVNGAGSGSTIVVRPGTYSGFSLSKVVDIIADGINQSDPRQNSVTINGQVISNSGGGWSWNEGPIIRGLRIIGGGDPIVMNDSPMTIEYNYIKATSGDGISFEGGGGIVKGNIIEVTGDDGIDVDHQTKNVVIEDNFILNSRQDGIEIRQHDDSISQRITLDLINNVIDGSGHDGFQIMDYGNFSNRHYNLKNNLITNSRYSAIALNADQETNAANASPAPMPEPVYVVNNTFAGNGRGALFGGHNLIAVNNIFFDNTTELIGLGGNSVVTHSIFPTNPNSSVVNTSTTVIADPKLNSDYALNSGSPAIDEGTTFYQHSYTGNSQNYNDTVVNISSGQYNGSAPDLGWKEY